MTDDVRPHERRYKISVDVGGTCTDVVVSDDLGRMTIGKALTTSGRVFDGMATALAGVARELSSTLGELLSMTDLLIYSTTAATNAILEGKTARTALLVTEGFRDVLVLREGGKRNAFDLSQSPPTPYVPRHLTYEIRERTSAEGDILMPLDWEAAVATVRRLRALDIEAVAVCLIWSIANPEAELALGQLLTDELPHVPYTLSHRLNPVVREYRRASSAAIDASLKPMMQRHLRMMGTDLLEAGFAGELLVATSFGGVMHVDDVVERPIYMVRSGPSLSPIAGREYARRVAASDSVIVCDTGGTSFDVALIRDGEIRFTRETWLGGRFTGHMTGLSSVDVRSIGTGGGSIAWLDQGGLLRVGPQSAGADPGPACYGRGGTDATTTDAAVVLGYVSPTYFLGGNVALDRKAAWAAVQAIAEPLGQDAKRTAAAILSVASDQMVQAIREITINEGFDPREALLVAGGGAAGLTIVPIAAELGCRQILVPQTAGVLSACGGQYTDILAEFTTSHYAPTSDFPTATINSVLEQLRESAVAFQRLLEKRGLSRFALTYFVEAKYPRQAWELEIPLHGDSFRGTRDLSTLKERFHTAHHRVFAVSRRDQEIECLIWKVRVKAMLQNQVALRQSTAPRDCEATVAANRRNAYFTDVGDVDTPVCRGEMLEPGWRAAGPVIVENPATTVVVHPDSSIEISENGDYLLTVTS